jgi:hypothetical protein
MSFYFNKSNVTFIEALLTGFIKLSARESGTDVNDNEREERV